MSFVIKWNWSREMVMLQNPTGGQLCTRSYSTFRFSIFIARKKTLDRKMIITKCLWFVIIYLTKSVNPHLQNYFLRYGTKYKKFHKTLYKVAPQWDSVAWPFLQINSILSQTTLPYTDYQPCSVPWNGWEHNWVNVKNRASIIKYGYIILIESNSVGLFRAQILISGGGEERGRGRW